jgi:hypothetical protein
LQSAQDPSQLTPDDEKFEFGVVASMLSEQNIHRERLDNKIAALIAASAGALYFFTDKASSIPDTVIGALFVVPLLLSLWAFSIREWKIVGPEGFVKTFAYYPSETRRVAIVDSVTAYSKNENQTLWKAYRAGFALLSAAALSVVAVGLKVVESIQSSAGGIASNSSDLLEPTQGATQVEPLIAIFLQVVLAGSAIWLAWETRRLRVQDKEQMRLAVKHFDAQIERSDKQLSLLRKQVRLGLLPPIILGPASLAQYKDYVNENVSDETERKAYVDSSVLKGQEPSFVCIVRNRTKRVALNLSGLLYEAETQKYFVAPRNLEQLGKGWDAFLFYEESSDMETVKANLEDQYGTSRVEFAVSHLIPKDKASFVIVLFTDLDGRVYLARRRFSLPVGGKAAGELFYQE